MKLEPGTKEYRDFVKSLLAQSGSEDESIEILRFGLPTLLRDQGLLWELLWELSEPYGGGKSRIVAVTTLLAQLHLRLEVV